MDCGRKERGCLSLLSHSTTGKEAPLSIHAYSVKKLRLREV
jgi:hypothetical protein